MDQSTIRQQYQPLAAPTVAQQFMYVGKVFSKMLTSDKQKFNEFSNCTSNKFVFWVQKPYLGENFLNSFLYMEQTYCFESLICRSVVLQYLRNCNHNVNVINTVHVYVNLLLVFFGKQLTLYYHYFSNGLLSKVLRLIIMSTGLI